MDSVADWIDAKPPRGNYTFTREEVVEAFPRMKPEVISTTLSREVKKGRIMIPQQGFYVIIPEEYKLRGVVPQAFYIDDLMRYLGRRYYVALLSAGSYYGAAHQVPMTFCVMTEPPTMRDKKTKKYATRFFYRQEIPMEYVEQRQTRTGSVNVSCPEQGCHGVGGIGGENGLRASGAGIFEGGSSGLFPAVGVHTGRGAGGAGGGRCVVRVNEAGWGALAEGGTEGRQGDIWCRVEQPLEDIGE